MFACEPLLQTSKARVHQAQPMFQAVIFKVSITDHNPQIFGRFANGDVHCLGIGQHDFQAVASVVMLYQLPFDGKTLSAAQLNDCS